LAFDFPELSGLFVRGFALALRDLSLRRALPECGVATMIETLVCGCMRQAEQQENKSSTKMRSDPKGTISTAGGAAWECGSVPAESISPRFSTHGVEDPVQVFVVSTGL